MLEILFLYSIGKKYSALAKKFGKKPTGPVILGIVTYYAFIVIAVIIFTLINGSKDQSSSIDLIQTFSSIPFGLIAAWGLYKYLEKKWSKIPFYDNDLLDEDLIQ